MGSISVGRRCSWGVREVGCGKGVVRGMRSVADAGRARFDGVCGGL